VYTHIRRSLTCGAQPYYRNKILRIQNPIVYALWQREKHCDYVIITVAIEKQRMRRNNS